MNQICAPKPAASAAPNGAISQWWPYAKAPIADGTATIAAMATIRPINFTRR